MDSGWATSLFVMNWNTKGKYCKYAVDIVGTQWGYDERQLATAAYRKNGVMYPPNPFG